jgi:hypothetical protein
MLSISPRIADCAKRKGQLAEHVSFVPSGLREVFSGSGSISISITQAGIHRVGASTVLPRTWLRVKLGSADHTYAGFDQRLGGQVHRTVLLHVVFLEGRHQARLLGVGLG